MRKRLTVWLVVPCIAVLMAACGPSSATFDESAHAEEVMQWRAGRLERLKQPFGYLTQVGLYWLQPGSYSFGSGAGNDIVLDGESAAEIGVFTVTANGVSMRVLPGVDVQSEGERVTDIEIDADSTGFGVTVTHGSLAWTVVERDGEYAIRLRDFEHPFVTSFGPLPYFDIDPALRVQAILHRYDEPRIANVATVIEGVGYHPEMPGLVEFEIGGESYELEAYVSGDGLFYVFGDQTNRDDTYGAGRFLYSSMPAEDGKTVLDFNYAYSPPCAFNDFSTCPVASPRNRLPIRLEAGEKYDAKLHYSAGH